MVQKHIVPLKSYFFHTYSKYVVVQQADLPFSLGELDFEDDYGKSRHLNAVSLLFRVT